MTEGPAAELKRLLLGMTETLVEREASALNPNRGRLAILLAIVQGLDQSPQA